MKNLLESSDIMCKEGFLSWYHIDKEFSGLKMKSSTAVFEKGQSLGGLIGDATVKSAMSYRVSDPTADREGTKNSGELVIYQ